MKWDVTMTVRYTPCPKCHAFSYRDALRTLFDLAVSNTAQGVASGEAKPPVAVPTNSPTPVSLERQPKPKRRLTKKRQADVATHTTA